MIAAALSMSSSAFVLQLLSERGESATRTGSATLGILLFQVRYTAVGRLWSLHWCCRTAVWNCYTCTDVAALLTSHGVTCISIMLYGVGWVSVPHWVRAGLLQVHFAAVWQLRAHT